MPTREIPRDEWNAFFETFSKQHEGWLVILRSFADDDRDGVCIAAIQVGGDAYER